MKKTASGFRIVSGDETVECDRLIVACGGLAGTKLGGSMSGYQILRSFGHSCTRLRPALVQLKSSWNAVTSLKASAPTAMRSFYTTESGFPKARGSCNLPVRSQRAGDFRGVPGCVSGGGEWLCRLDFLPDMAENA